LTQLFASLDFSPSVERNFLCSPRSKRKKRPELQKKAQQREKTSAFRDLTTAMLGLTTAAFYLETGKKCRLSGPIVAAALSPQFGPESGGSKKDRCSGWDYGQEQDRREEKTVLLE
jgi:hypothetical protein